MHARRQLSEVRLSSSGSNTDEFQHSITVSATATVLKEYELVLDELSDMLADGGLQQRRSSLSNDVGLKLSQQDVRCVGRGAALSGFSLYFVLFFLRLILILMKHHKMTAVFVSPA